MEKKIISVILLSTICVIQNLALAQGASDQKSSESVFQLTLPEVDITPFLPQQKAEGNAAEFYVKALALLEHYPGKDRLLKDVAEEPDKLLQDKQIKEMLSNICEGARTKNCDLTIAYPVPASGYDKMWSWDFGFFQGMCKALGKRAEYHLHEGNYPDAIEQAKMIVAVGNHVHQSAYHPIGEMGGISFEQMGIRSLQKIYQKMNDSANANLCQEAADKLQQAMDIIGKKMSAKGPELTLDKLMAMLKDKAPCMRIDALLIIGNAFYPDLEKRAEESREEFKKQFGAERGEKMFKESDPRPYLLQLRTKKEDLKSAIALLLNDPDKGVRDVAEKVAERLK